jgi:3-deoxy-D-manno-octulosonate 8-phosphate phosphatase KdsC-like HAD superfamily phosphatase
MENFKEKLTRVEAFVFDVDGVFNDGSISPVPSGDLLRTYNAKDGYAITYAVSEGYKIFVVTGARGPLLEERFKSLKITGLYPNSSDKTIAMRDIAEKHGISCKISAEQRMGCGMGACLCCSIMGRDGHYRTACSDGPVFGAEEVVIGG